MTSKIHSASQPPRWVARVELAIRILLAGIFLAAGGAKLVGAPSMVQLFSSIGVGQWFRVATGVVEIIGAILVILPSSAGVGAALVGMTMAFAVLTHVVRIGGNPVPAIVLLALSVLVLWLRRAREKNASAQSWRVTA